MSYATLCDRISLSLSYLQLTTQGSNLSTINLIPDAETRSFASFIRSELGIARFEPGHDIAAYFKSSSTDVSNSSLFTEETAPNSSWFDEILEKTHDNFGNALAAALVMGTAIYLLVHVKMWVIENLGCSLLAGVDRARDCLTKWGGGKGDSSEGKILNIDEVCALAHAMKSGSDEMLADYILQAKKLTMSDLHRLACMMNDGGLRDYVIEQWIEQRAWDFHPNEFITYDDWPRDLDLKESEIHQKILSTYLIARGGDLGGPV